MNDKISVIVPVYKVEKYLDRCVQSIAAQTYENLEIILVDDGSPDNCGRICDDWAQKDSRIKVVHKENGGLSSARNAGVAVATGSFVGFVDSDDYIQPQMYEKLYEALVETGADVSICGCDYVDEETGAPDLNMRTRSPLKKEVLTREQAYHKISHIVDGYGFYVTAWNKLYPRKLFDRLQFKEGFVHEDEFFIHHLFGRCSRIATIPDALYMYVQRSGSITKTKVTIRSLHGVYSYYDRYQFFCGQGERQMARKSLRAANMLLTDLLYRMEKEADGQELQETVRRISFRMIANLDWRVAYLMKAWLLFCLRKD